MSTTRIPAVLLAALLAPCVVPTGPAAASRAETHVLQDGGQAAPPPRDAEADRKAATEAIAEIVKAYRSAKGVEVEVEVVVGARNGGGGGNAPAVKLKATFGEKRQAIVSLRDYQLRIARGKIVATHDSNQLAYLEVSDHGSPYYALFNAFQALPIPELALALGEDATDEVCMQLLPQLPEVLPVRVEDEEVDGQAAKVVVLESDDATQSIRMSFDPETKLVERTVGTKKSGEEVEQGAELTWTVRSKAKVPAKAPDASTFAFDSTGKQKVDGLAALIVRDPGAAADRDVASLKAGEPAPTLALPKVGGGDWDLVGQRPKPVLIDFWATWCGPCKAALPGLAKLKADFEGKVEVMMVNAGEQGSREEREASIAKVFRERKVELPCVLDLDGQAARRWLIRAFPTTFLIAPDGKIAGVWEGSSPRTEREIREKLKALCEVPPPAAK